jgi:N-acyl amino acid synthase FeeM
MPVRRAHLAIPTPAGGDGGTAPPYAASMNIPLLSTRLRRLGGAPVAAPRTAYALRRATSPEDWARVRGLRFAALAHHEDMPGDAARAFGDAHDARAGTTTFLLVRDGAPLASTRTSVAAVGEPATLPAAQTFPREIEGLAVGARVVEASLTVVDPAAEDGRAAIFRLYRAHMLACAATGAGWLVTTVRDTQIGFYRRVFDMEILSGAEMAAGLAVPRVLMGLRPREAGERLARRIPLLAVSARDVQRYEDEALVTF